MNTLTDHQRYCPILVGNGALPKGTGRHIDGFRCVIRLNNFKLDGYADRAGCRVDIVAACVDAHGATTCAPEAAWAREIWWATDRNARQLPSDCWAIGARAHGLQVFMFDAPEYCAKMNALNFTQWEQAGDDSARVSTGMLALYFALQQHQRVVLAGFDWGRTGHYFNPDHQHDPKHKWDWEREHAAFLASVGRVVYLNDLVASEDGGNP